MNIIGICAISVITAVIVIFLRQYKEDYAVVVIILTSLLIFSLVCYNISIFLTDYFDIVETVGIDSGIFTVLLKALGISYLAVFSADICRDLGQTALAGRIELAAKVAVVILSLPIIKQIIEMISEMMK